MSVLAKLTLKTVNRQVQKDPVIARRDKLCEALELQMQVLDAALRGEDHKVDGQKWMTNDTGERVQVNTQRKARAWFFQQDGGWYVQCRYGSRILNIYGKSNAVFVDKLEDVAGVLQAFKNAAESGELDKAVVLASKTVTS
jgi:hypothetical protein